MSINKKMGEHKIEYPVLLILNDYGPLTTSELKEHFRKFTNPSGVNLTPLLNRNDEAIDQIVRNIVSHRRDSKNNMIYRGLIDYSSNGVLSITDKGKEHLRKLSQQLYAQSMK